MSEVPSTTQDQPGAKAALPVAVAEVDSSCRLPLLVLFISAAIWLAIASIFGMISSIQFHSPSFLADCAWLTYGRVRPAGLDALIYGVGVQAGLGVTLWLLARLGATRLVLPGMITAGASLWNLGITLGIAGILAGGGTGFESFELPREAQLVAFIGYAMMAVWAVLTFHVRRERPVVVSHWFLLAALFWFAWIGSTAHLLLLAYPVRGVAQSVIAWWFSANLQVVWFGLIGLGAAFYLVPKLTGRQLYSDYLAVFAFWTLILFGSWTGILNGAPVPAWMQAISAVARVLMLLPLLAVALNLYRTLAAPAPAAARSEFPIRFMVAGLGAYVLCGLLGVATAHFKVSAFTDFTWFAAARAQLNLYGFFVLVLFGAVYYILPQIMGLEFPRPKLVRAHFWLAVTGILLVVVPQFIGGIIQGYRLHIPSPQFAYLDVFKTTLIFLRVATIGDLLIAVGHVVFLVNVLGLVSRFYRARAAAAYTAMTAPMQPMGAKA